MAEVETVVAQATSRERELDEKLTEAAKGRQEAEALCARVKLAEQTAESRARTLEAELSRVYLAAKAKAAEEEVRAAEAASRCSAGKVTVQQGQCLQKTDFVRRKITFARRVLQKSL